MDDFKTVQDLLQWNQSQVHKTSPTVNYGNLKAEEIAKVITSQKDPALALEVAKYLIGSLVTYHKHAVDAKRKTNADDVYVWAYDYAQLNSALTILHAVESPED